MFHRTARGNFRVFCVSLPIQHNGVWGFSILLAYSHFARGCSAERWAGTTIESYMRCNLLPPPNEYRARTNILSWRTPSAFSGLVRVGRRSIGCQDPRSMRACAGLLMKASTERVLILDNVKKKRTCDENPKMVELVSRVAHSDGTTMPSAVFTFRLIYYPQFGNMIFTRYCSH